MTTGDDTPVPDYPGRLRLDGQRFIVLGAGQGIGRQSAHALAAVGARVACVDVEAPRALEVAAEVDGVAVVGDATRRADAERLFEEAATALAGLDGVVDIIGMARYASVLQVGDGDWDWQFDIVLRHAYLAVQLGGQRLAAGSGGVLAFVASVSGLTSAPSCADTRGVQTTPGATARRATWRTRRCAASPSPRTSPPRCCSSAPTWPRT